MTIRYSVEAGPPYGFSVECDTCMISVTNKPLTVYKTEDINRMTRFLAESAALSHNHRTHGICNIIIYERLKPKKPN